MGRPGGAKAAAQKTSKNPFSAWFESREQRKREAEEQAAQQITNDTAANEAKIVVILKQIDFLHSPIPQELLESKTDPNQPCGDLEYGAKAAVWHLTNHPQNINADLRPIDEKLLVLAAKFKESVKHGDWRAAYAAKAGLLRGLQDVRGLVPEVDREQLPEYMEQNTTYLGEWVTLVNLAEGADRMEKTVQLRRDEYESAKAENAELQAQLDQEISTDRAKNEAFKVVAGNKSMEEREGWSEEVKDMHKELVRLQMNDVENDLKHKMLNAATNEYLEWNHRVEIMNSKLLSTRYVPNPNALNEFEDAVKGLLHDLAESDAAFDETLKFMEELEGSLRQLESAPGEVHAQEIATARAQKFIKDMQQKEMDKLRDPANGGAQLTVPYKLTDEQTQEIKRQNLEQAQREAQQLMQTAQQAQNTNDQNDENQQVQYN